MLECPVDAPREVRFLRLGFQCPYTLWFREQARKAACELGSPFTDHDVTGDVELAAVLGAYPSMQVALTGCPLLAAPRPAAAIITELAGGCVAVDCEERALPHQVAVPSVGIHRPGDPDWRTAVEASARICVSSQKSEYQMAGAVALKLQWLNGLASQGPMSGPAIFTAGRTADPDAFAEVIPVSAAHIPVPFSGPRDLYLTCIHANSDPAGDPRADLLGKMVSSFADTSAADDGVTGIWAVSGRNASYPNGPVRLFFAAGFREIGGLGKLYLPGRGYDEMVLLRWEPVGADSLQRAIGIVVNPQDNVATLPSGGNAGDALAAHGLSDVIRLTQNIPPGHKAALRNLKAGDQITKYGQTIGTATADTTAGEHVHIHNMSSGRAGGSRSAAPGGDTR